MFERTLRMEELTEAGFSGGRGWLILSTTRVVWGAKNRLGEGEKWSVRLEYVEAASARKPKGTSAIETIEIQYRERGSLRTRKFQKVSITSFFTLGGASRLEPGVLQAFADAVIGAREAVLAAKLQALPTTPEPAAAASAAHETTGWRPRGGVFDPRTGRFVGEPEHEVLTAPEPAGASVEPTGSADSEFVSALERLAALHERGVLSDDEFSAGKARLLNKPGEPDD